MHFNSNSIKSLLTRANTSFRKWHGAHTHTHTHTHTPAHKSEFTTHCGPTTLVLIRSAASKKNDCATANELLKASMCEAQIDLYTTPIKGWRCIIENLWNINGHWISSARCRTSPGVDSCNVSPCFWLQSSSLATPARNCNLNNEYYSSKRSPTQTFTGPGDGFNIMRILGWNHLLRQQRISILTIVT